MREARVGRPHEEAPRLRDVAVGKLLLAALDEFEGTLARFRRQRDLRCLGCGGRHQRGAPNRAAGGPHGERDTGFGDGRAIDGDEAHRHVRTSADTHGHDDAQIGQGSERHRPHAGRDRVAVTERDGRRKPAQAEKRIRRQIARRRHADAQRHAR